MNGRIYITEIVLVGGGGIPTCHENKKLVGVEAVIDRDLCSALLAQELDADM